MELTYRWVSDSTYEFTVLFYRDCGSFATSPPMSITLEANSILLNSSFQTSLARLPLVGLNIPPIRTQDMVSCAGDNRCNCSQIKMLCLEEFVYRGNMTIPGKSSDWTFSYLGCCMPEETDNVFGPMFCLAGINNLDFPDSLAKNISPVWHDRRPNIPGFPNDTIVNYPYRTFCQNRTYLVKQGAVERQGDRVKYEFISPEPLFLDTQQTGPAIKYISPYSLINPLPLDPSQLSLQIDSISGYFIYKPATFDDSGSKNVYLLCIKATEYRFDSVSGKEKQIGFTIRNLMMRITPDSLCPDSAITFSVTQSQFPYLPMDSMSLRCDDNPIIISFTERVECSSVDTNGSCFILVDINSSDTVNILSTEASCKNKEYYSRSLNLFLDSSLSVGIYRLMIRSGTDGNTMFTECGREIDPFNDTLEIYALQPPGIGEITGDFLMQSFTPITDECGVTSLKVYLTDKILCNSIAGNASDFTLIDSSVIPPKSISLVSAKALNCIAGYTRTVEVFLAAALKAGNYKLSLVMGSDSNTFTNYCGFLSPESMLDVNIPDLDVDLGPDFSYCKNTSFDTTLLAGSSFAYYTWNTGSHNSSIAVDTAGIYWVDVFNNLGCKKRDSIVVTEKKCYVGINQNQTSQKISIYPNPTNGTIHIKSTEQIHSIKLQDLQGRVMLQRQNISTSEYLIDISHLNQSMYFLYIRTSSDFYRERIVKVE